MVRRGGGAGLGLPGAADPECAAAARVSGQRSPGHRPTAFAARRDRSDKLDANKRVQPPPVVARDDVLEALAAAADRMDAALASLSEERGERFAIAHPVIGIVPLAHVGEWATAHVIRHNAQAKRVLGL